MLKGGDVNIEALVAKNLMRKLTFFLNFLDDSIEKTLCSSLCGPKVQAKPTDHTKPWSLGAKVSVTSSLPSRNWWRFTGAELGFFQKSGGFF